MPVCFLPFCAVWRAQISFENWQPRLRRVPGANATIHHRREKEIKRREDSSAEQEDALVQETIGFLQHYHHLTLLVYTRPMMMLKHKL